MRPVGILTVASVCLANGAAQYNPTAEFLTAAQTLKSLLHAKVAQKANFTEADTAQLMPRLASAGAVEDLILREKVTFDVSGLSVPEDQARDAIASAATASKAWLRTWVQSYVARKTGPEAEETKAMFRWAANDLSNTRKLVASLASKMDQVFLSRPELVAAIHATIAAMPDLFDNEGLRYTKLFLSVTNEVQPELADQLWVILAWGQGWYGFIPSAQFDHLRDVYSTARNHPDRLLL